MKIKQWQLFNGRTSILTTSFYFLPFIQDREKKAEQNSIKTNSKTHPCSLSQPLLWSGKNTPFPTSAPAGFHLSFTAEKKIIQVLLGQQRTYEVNENDKRDTVPPLNSSRWSLQAAEANPSADVAAFVPETSALYQYANHTKRFWSQSLMFFVVVVSRNWNQPLLRVTFHSVFGCCCNTPWIFKY